MPTAEYHWRQAELVARLCLVESDPVKATKLHLIALEHLEKAQQAKAEKQPDSAVP